MKLVILDRDGVINRDSPDHIRTVADWQPLPGSLAAIAALTRAGWTIVVATNQSGVGRGLIEPAELDRIHARMRADALETGGVIDRVFWCPHAPEAGCDCRKPATGLFRQVAAAYGMSLDDVPAIGDSARDIVAACAAGCRPILVMTGNGHRALQSLGEGGVPERYPDLAAAAAALIREGRH
jgi:D-glycero-D-manno-heptose 1,7-bisphosphate phosphatase